MPWSYYQRFWQVIGPGGISGDTMKKDRYQLGGGRLFRLRGWESSQGTSFVPIWISQWSIIMRIPLNVGDQEGRLGGGKRGSKSNCPKGSWNHRTPSTQHCMTLWSGQEQRGALSPTCMRIGATKGVSVPDQAPRSGDSQAPGPTSTLSHQGQAQDVDGDC